MATFGDMRELSRYYGTLSAPNRFNLSTKAAGEIKSLLVDIGDSLESGQLVARLDDEEYGLARERADLNVSLSQAQLSEAQANLDLAESDMRRQSSLTKKNIVTQSDFEAAQNKLLQAQARLDVAKSQLRSASNQLADADLRLSYTKVVASWPEQKPGETRYVSSRLANEGQLVTANTPLFEVVSLDPLLVVVDVIEKDYPKFFPGMEATLSTEAFPGEIFTAKVLRVAPVLSNDSRQARLELEVSNPDLKLKPGMYADVVFVFNEHKGVWSVADDVPFRRQEGYVIFKADVSSGTVSQIPVTLGLNENGRVELIGVEPLEAPVVTLGQHLLQDGQPFKVADEEVFKALTTGSPAGGVTQAPAAGDGGGV
ncbi:MAG: efflux RND transporter periplasmic adaptor subunit [Deltaproteobacteria bacterium]|jgi:multidrug efflux pump subunit AcrA (membrane-fusion protein)|nr:efflux RND transporter periplasmic adaptor subunit [Deltaproteobacteria bacterium]